MGTLAKLKEKARSGAEIALDIAGLAVSVSGASVAAIFGKFIVGLVLGALAIGFVLRLKLRRPSATATRPAQPWTRVAAATLSAIEAAALVEATNLPVRFGQDGFAYGHWGLVSLVLVALYLLQVGLLKRLTAGPRGASAA